MAKTNSTARKRKVAAPAPVTHNGAAAARISTLDELKRTVLGCLLWEDNFYESGESVAQRIKNLVAASDPSAVAALAVEARSQYKLRHVPLLLTLELLRKNSTQHLQYPVWMTVRDVIQRPDELSELVSLYWADGKKPVPAQLKKGLAAAFQKFNAYSLAKYNRDSKITLRDVMFLAHPEPKDKAQEVTFEKLANKTLESPDTWEVALSGGADKKETFTRLLQEKKLGYLALLRNLRNMEVAGVERKLVNKALLDEEALKRGRVLPFRFITAVQHAPAYRAALGVAMDSMLKDLPQLKGNTLLMVDVSGSMVGPTISAKSDLDRRDAAAALAALIRGVSEKSEIYTFTTSTTHMPQKLYGFDLIDQIKAQPAGGTMVGRAVDVANARGYDRLIVITDEQSSDSVAAPNGLGYMINVASYQNGVGYDNWVHIDGFSEAVVTYIQELEQAIGFQPEPVVYLV